MCRFLLAMFCCFGFAGGLLGKTHKFDCEFDKSLRITNFKTITVELSRSKGGMPYLRFVSVKKAQGNWPEEQYKIEGFASRDESSMEGRVSVTSYKVGDIELSFSVGDENNINTATVWGFWNDARAVCKLKMLE